MLAVLSPIWLAIRTFLGITSSANGLLALVAVGLVMVFGYAEYRYAKGKAAGRAATQAEVVEGAKDAEIKAETEQRAAARPGALERLRADPRTCPECQPKAGNGKSLPVVAAPPR